MATYKFIKLIELDKLDKGVRKKYIQEEVSRSKERLNGAACEFY